MFSYESFLRHQVCAAPDKTVTGLQNRGVEIPCSLITNEVLSHDTLIQRDEKSSGPKRIHSRSPCDAAAVMDSPLSLKVHAWRNIVPTHEGRATTRLRQLLIDMIEAAPEHARQALARTITSSYRGADGLLPVMTFDPQIERMIRERVQEGISLEPQAAQRIMTGVQRSVESFTKRGLLPVFLAGAGVRRHLRQLIGHYMPQVAVLSHNEIADGVKIQSLGIIRWGDES